MASVKPAVSAPFGGRPLPGLMGEVIGFEGGPGSKAPGRIHYTGVTFKMILVHAYGVRPYQISGPGWIDTERYDIDAKYPVDTKSEDFRLMLQKLLAERFQLALNRETREMPRYRLVVAKSGPKLSPPEKFKDEEERRAAMEKRTREKLRNFGSGPLNGLHQQNITMAKFAETLSSLIKQPVKDDTGLKGSYSLSLNWLPEESPAARENSLPTIYEAVQEQLGLKLEAEKGPLEFLLIEHAEKTPVVN